MLNVLKPGFFSTIQDAGRIGYQQYGMIVSGVMDEVAFRLGNALLRQHNKAAIEMTSIGGTFQFIKPAAITLTGGVLEAMLNGQMVAMNKVIHVQAGDTLVCGVIRKGTRSYLCIRGGFQVDEVLNSRSTYVKAQLGGYKGRVLKRGDVIPYESKAAKFTRLQLHTAAYYGDAPIRILPGTEWARFSDEMRQHFLSQAYIVSLAADRMGYRLENKQLITVAEPFQLLSEAVTFGTVQIPPSGQPIILMADRQTTGGYPKIAQVIHADLYRLAQFGPNTVFHFELVTLAEAEQAFIEKEQQVKLMELLLSQM